MGYITRKSSFIAHLTKLVSLYFVTGQVFKNSNPTSGTGDGKKILAAKILDNGNVTIGNGVGSAGLIFDHS